MVSKVWGMGSKKVWGQIKKVIRLEEQAVKLIVEPLIKIIPEQEVLGPGAGPPVWTDSNIWPASPPL